MLRKSIRRYGRTVVVTDAQIAFDKILEQTDVNTKGSPFCSSDSSHTSSINSSLSVDHCSSTPARPQTRNNVKNSQKQKLLKVKGICSRENQHECRGQVPGNRSSSLLFHEESDSLVLCTPVKKKKPLKVFTGTNLQSETNKKLNTQNKGNVKSIPLKNNNWCVQENVPDFDDIAQDDLIISSSPGDAENQFAAGRLGQNTSIFSQSTPNVSLVRSVNSHEHIFPSDSSLASPKCANVTFRCAKRAAKAGGKAAKFKSKLSADSGNLSDDNAAGNRFELSDSDSCQALDDVDNLSSSFHVMRLCSFNIAQRFASSPQGSLYNETSMQDGEAGTSAGQPTSSLILFEEASCVTDDLLASPMPLILEEASCSDKLENGHRDQDEEEEEDGLQEEEEEDGLQDEEEDGLQDEEEDGLQEEEDGLQDEEEDGLQDEEEDGLQDEEEDGLQDEKDDKGIRSQSLNITSDLSVVASNMSFSEKLSNSSFCKDVPVTAMERVLSLCGQTEPVSFTDCIPSRMMSKCVKIGEGVYGEVFRSFSHGQALALKIIPIEGDQLFNDCPQKRFEEILPEIVIAKELSDLMCSGTNQTSSFCQVASVSCVQGEFPSKLLEQWDIYSKNKVSENDRPDMFSCDQLFIVFEFGDGGCPLENYKFLNHMEAFSVLRQIVFALAVAESELEFEHRDLHIGNVLVRSCPGETILFKLQGREYQWPTEGVTATIIDFTISRLKKDGCAVFCDISTDHGLFEGEGDFQFDVYRDMRSQNGNDWNKFCPHSNILWVNYILKKFNEAIKFKDTARKYRDIQRHMRGISERVLSHQSCLALSQDTSLWLPENYV